MRAHLLLCDWAEAIAGKLYMQGAGWNTIAANRTDQVTAVAMLLYVPYDRTNRRTKVACALRTADGGPYPSDGNQPAQFGFEFEVGRPPGLRPGVEQIVPFAAKINGLPFAVGEYEWVLEVDGAALASASFTAIGA